jgi:hypothetical protein
LFFAVGGDVNPVAAREGAKAVVTEWQAPCCVQIAAATAPRQFDTSHMKFNLEELAPASRSRAEALSSPEALRSPEASLARADLGYRALPVGVAPENGLQVRTILVARSISVLFPEIHEIGGVRPDALRWHPEGLALDVMIPDPSSDSGIELGNAIVTFVMQNAERFGIQDAIWRGIYYTPGGGAQSGGYGHYDHVHVTTTGGGYPSGDEIYVR